MFAGRVKILSHSSCRASAILKYFCPLVGCEDHWDIIYHGSWKQNKILLTLSLQVLTCNLLITFAKSLDPDQDSQNVRH